MIWESLFQKHILERGFDYYKRHLVDYLDISEHIIEATVCGNEEYVVDIEIEDEEIIEMNCTCPYANDGNHCKHMAAVLFCAEDEAKDYLYKYKSSGMVDSENQLGLEESVAKLLKEADELEVRDFLANVLISDEKLLNRFRNLLCHEISLADLDQYRKQINRIFRRYIRDDFIDYRSASFFLLELEEFLNEDIQAMIKNKHYQEAFELTNYIFVKLGKQNIDDSDGEIGVLAEICLEIWKEILAHCDIDLKREMFRWFSDNLDGSIIDYLEEYLEEILFENFIEKEFLEKKLNFTANKVSMYKNAEASWSRDYQVGKWALLHILIMEEQNADQNVIDEYCNKNLQFSAVKEYYIENCIKRKDYKLAIQLLKKAKKEDKCFPGLVLDYSLKLKNLFKEQGNHQAYEEELWLLILQYRAGDINIYSELKLLYSDQEWQEKREIIFSKLPPHARIDKLYAVEKLYDRLLKVVLNASGLHLLMEYEKILKVIYPNELFEKYERVVENMASRTTDRRYYREIVSVLRRMQKYPSGKEKVAKIVVNWQTRYKNRSAMIDELRKL